MVRKLVVFGGYGGLGRQLIPHLSNYYDVVAPTSSEVDLGDLYRLRNYIESQAPFFGLINLAAINFNSYVSKAENLTGQAHINITAPTAMVKFAVSVMKQTGGRVIFASSILSRNPKPGTGLYSAQKAYIDSLVRTCAIENARFGITFNSIQMGYFDGGLTYKIPSDLLPEIVDSIPLKRLGRIEELFSAVDFLLNTEYVTGSNLLIAGGL